MCPGVLLLYVWENLSSRAKPHDCRQDYVRLGGREGPARTPDVGSQLQKQVQSSALQTMAEPFKNLRARLHML